LSLSFFSVFTFATFMVSDSTFRTLFRVFTMILCCQWCKCEMQIGLSLQMRCIAAFSNSAVCLHSHILLVSNCFCYKLLAFLPSHKILSKINVSIYYILSKENVELVVSESNQLHKKYSCQQPWPDGLTNNRF
jgi:hypothetical protein